VDVEKGTEKGTEEASAEVAVEGEAEEEEEAETPPLGICRRIWNRWWQFYFNNDFVVMIVIAILLAKAYPPLGADYLQPQITSTWIAVVFIFGTYNLSEE
jgi:sodium/bile acid cotransporter 7